jgi:NhaP-type Na+/H+ or K+/H+ antiporter
LLGIGLPLTIVAGTVAGALVLRDVTWIEAAVLAVVLAPTDAALGQAVVTDPALPSRIRQGLNVESGLNDGLCVPLLAIALALAQTEAHDTTLAHAGKIVVEAIGWGVVGGVVAGGVTACVLRIARAHDWIETHWVQVVPVAAAAGAYGIADARGGSGFIAAFVGGIVFGIVARQTEASAAFSEELGGVLNAVTLIVFGAAILGTVWPDIGVVEVLYFASRPWQSPCSDRAHGRRRSCSSGGSARADWPRSSSPSSWSTAPGCPTSPNSSQWSPPPSR